MELHSYVGQVQAQLIAAASLGDERTRVTANALAAAAEPAVRLAVLGAVSSAADEITAALLDSPGSPGVSVRLDGDDVRIEVRTAEVADTAGPALSGEEVDNSARISLRLGETLKSQIESAARTDAVSVNAWLLRAAAGALSAAGRHGANPWDARQHGGASQRITGWINS